MSIFDKINEALKDHEPWNRFVDRCVELDITDEDQIVYLWSVDADLDLIENFDYVEMV